ncbi:MAG: tetratricopeptide repeat protein [Terriglobales bacterium]
MSSSSPVALAKSLEARNTSASSTLFRSPEKHTLLFSLLLIASVLAFYSPITHNGFLNYDDDTYITNNPHVRTGLTWPTVKWAFTTYDAANYHPLIWLSHALDCQLFGVNPAAHHEVSVLLHAASAVLLFLLLQAATGFAWRSLFVAALFALHPVNVESVAWAAERKNVLSMLFFLLALHAYVWYTRRPALHRYVLIVFLFVLALLSKPQVITFPFLLLLLDYWPLNRFRFSEAKPAPGSTCIPPRFSSAWLVLEKLPLVLLSVASAMVTMKAQRAGGAIQTMVQYSPLLRLETAVIAYVRYLGKAFWPSNLVALYPHPTRLYPVWQVGAAALLLMVITAAALRTRERRYLIVGWLWFLGSLVPMLGLVQVGGQAIADRYAYIPFIGLFVMCTWLVADCAKTGRGYPIFARFMREKGIRAACLSISALACLLILGLLTFRQVHYWHDTQSFWQRTLALTENNYVAHDSLGDFLAREGRTEEAAAQYRAAIAIRSDDLPANLNLATLEANRGNLQDAIERYQMVARYAADTSLRATAYGNLGSAYRQLGDSARATQCYEAALQLDPKHAMAMIGLGLIAQKNADLPEAVRHYSLAMAVEPTDVGYLLLAQALQKEGRSGEANALRERVARLSPNLAEAEKEAQALLAGK